MNFLTNAVVIVFEKQGSVNKAFVRLNQTKVTQSARQRSVCLIYTVVMYGEYFWAEKRNS